LTSSGVLVINVRAEEKFGKQSQLQTQILMKKYYLLTGLIASTVVLFASNALASDILTIEGLASGTAGVALDSSPVITAVLSQPGTYGGHTYTGWSFLVRDGTGSLDVFASAASLTSVDPGYTPTVDDVISLTGTYSPFHQIPEMATLTAFSKVGTAVAPGPVVQTIPTLNQATLPFSTAGYLIEVDNVTISGGGTFSTVFPTYAGGNVSYTMTDGSGNNMVLYDWVTSYSTAAAMGGSAVPTGPVDIIGFDSVFTSGSTSTAEFTPMAIISVPEPTTLGLCGAGGLLALIFRLRRKA
jgi:hypothetical protein